MVALAFALLGCGGHPATVSLTRHSHQTASPPAGPAVVSVQAVGPRLLIAAGADGVLSSADGGRTWVTRLAVPAPVRLIDAVSQQVWLAVTKTSLWRTTDGGRHWRPLALPPSGSVAGADFWTPDAGVAQSTAGNVVLTKDSGATWRPLRLPAGWTLQPGGIPGSPPVSVCFAGRGTGWAVAARGGRRGVLVSTDSGKSWRVALRPGALSRAGASRSGLAIAGCAGNAGWVSVSRATSRFYNHPAYDVLRSTNGGRTWLDVLRAGPHGVPWPPAGQQPPGGATRAPDGHTYSVLQPLSVAAPNTAWYTLVNQYGGGLGTGGTGNAGLSWSSHWFAQAKARPDAPPMQPWLDTAALSARRAVALFGSSRKGLNITYLYGTTDAGKSWHLVTVFRPHG